MLVAALVIGAAVTLLMLIAWVVQAWVGNAGWVDVFWTFGTGFACAGGALAAGPALWRRTLVAALVLFWCARLGSHIAKRVARGAEDTRYARMRAANPGSFQRNMLLLILPQGPFSLFLGLAVLYAARQPALEFRPWDGIGFALALGAMAGEALADRQMRQFRADPAHKGKICDTGLWAFSRHPNYLFEFLFWCAWPVVGITTGTLWSLLSLLGPAFMYLTLRYASGVPPLEAAMLESRGDAYKAYQARTGAIFPRFWNLR